MAKQGSSIGGWAFLIGVLLAVLMSFITIPGQVWLLAVLGLIIGFLNITETETSKFLTAGTVLVIVGSLGSQGLAGVMYLEGVFANLVNLFAVSTMVVAIKAAFHLARN